MNFWYVYALRSLVKKFVYVGSTNDIRRRMDEHANGLVQSTKAYLPLELAAYVAVPTERKARELEKYFKAGSGKAVLKKRILS
ncbi:MAG TPA: GIY-YIG nuclease family protein [Bacteroidota bacterium]|nr:GIY-YIG nuclease family protein [Bacteroidota bacterium]